MRARTAQAALAATLCLVLALLPVPAAARVEILAQVGNGPWVKAASLSIQEGERVRLKVEPRPGASIRWRQLVPDLDVIYANANQPWEKDAYKWKGFAKIHYASAELSSLRGAWEIDPLPALREGEVFSRSASAPLGFLAALLPGSGPEPPRSVFYHTDCGAFWLQAEVEKDGKIETSPGVESADAKGLSPSVFRIAVRCGEGYLGYVTSFYNVPGLFGSVPYQSANYLGADCADLLMAAHHHYKKIPLTKDYNVAGLVTSSPRVATANIALGEPDKKLVWGKDILPGDLIAVRYVGARQFQHVGVLLQDANKNGVLDSQDLLLHAGPRPLAPSLFSDGYFDGEVVIMRLP